MAPSADGCPEMGHFISCVVWFLHERIEEGVLVCLEGVVGQVIQLLGHVYEEHTMHGRLYLVCVVLVPLDNHGEHLHVGSHHVTTVNNVAELHGSSQHVKGHLAEDLAKQSKQHTAWYGRNPIDHTHYQDMVRIARPWVDSPDLDRPRRVDYRSYTVHITTRSCSLHAFRTPDALRYGGYGCVRLLHIHVPHGHCSHVECLR
mmetsp:Transcript_575/g.1347  ORF Transcript_575/g.1347 Transcript_575/m.1347 type:complete len:202 (-) Transcript_575:1151-1756(-)